MSVFLTAPCIPRYVPKTAGIRPAVLAWYRVSILLMPNHYGVLNRGEEREILDWHWLPYSWSWTVEVKMKRLRRSLTA